MHVLYEPPEQSTVTLAEAGPLAMTVASSVMASTRKQLLIFRSLFRTGTPSRESMSKGSIALGSRPGWSACYADQFSLDSQTT